MYSFRGMLDFEPLLLKAIAWLAARIAGIAMAQTLASCS